MNMKPKPLIAIHQPNFFPWIGYFNKIVLSDVFVLLDDVQFQKTGGTWTNRVKLNIQGDAKWITVPIVRSYHGTKSINEIEINNQTPWREKIISTLQMNYSRAPFYDEVVPFISDLLNNPTSRLAEYNIFAIMTIAKKLELNVSSFVRSSTLNTIGNATDLLISITKSLDGNGYLTGSGAGGYQNDEQFRDADIDLIYQNFKHPIYPQSKTSEFVSGLSIIDVLLNCGFSQTQAIIKDHKLDTNG